MLKLKNLAVCFGLLLFSCHLIAEEQALCAEVKIEIAQELTIERQGFEAIMKITNSLDTYAIEAIQVTVDFTDADGNAVTATSNTQSTSAAFFIRVDDSNGVTGLQTADDGKITNGSIASNTVGEMRWLIIPTEQAAQDPNGTLFLVGATLTYQYGGKEETVTVAPDSIVVKPQPKITLDYFLTEEVIGDDAFTAEVEPPQPYTLGVRVVNNGLGEATAVKIESAQPRIVENKENLLVDFKIIESYLKNLPAEKTLLLDFGNIPSKEMITGRWVMETTLSGKFTSLDTRFSHADELGGQLTSLLEATNSYFLVHDVQVDLAGRDTVRDYLAKIETGTGYRLFESEATGADLADCTSCADVSVATGSVSGSGYQRTLTVTGVNAGFNYIKVADPFAGDKALMHVIRADGKTLNTQNAWISQERNEDKINFDFYLNVFDADPSITYTLVYGDVADVPQPPVIAYMTDRTTVEGNQVGFLVRASDPNGTVPLLTAENLPTGAEFTLSEPGNGVFSWHAEVGQAGVYSVNFHANDGLLTSDRSVKITVNPANDEDGDGMDDDWEREHFGDTSRDGSGDYDGDDISDLQEFQLDTDPTSKETVPAVPQIASPVYNATTLIAADTSQPLLPTLAIVNSAHPSDMQVAYQFEVYADESLTDQIVAADAVVESVAHVDSETELVLTTALLSDDKSFVDNHYYYWRARAYTLDASNERLYSDWVNSRFFINTANDAPSAPQISSPAGGTTVASLKPLLVITNSQDIDGDTVAYTYKLYQDGLADPIASISGLLANSSGETSWQVPVKLQEDMTYHWQVTAMDDNGAETSSDTSTFLVSLVNNPPSGLAILAPQQGAEIAELGNNASLWLSVMNANDAEHDSVQYWFDVDVVNTFDSAQLQSFGPVTEGENALEEGTTRMLLSNLQENQQYFWRAKAGDGAGESAWVQSSFIVSVSNTPPSVPVVVSPGDDSVIETLMPVLEVAPSTDPEDQVIVYRFELYDDASYQTLLGTYTGMDVSWALESALDDNRYYYWRVQAEDETGEASEWQTAHFFTNDNGLDDAPQINWLVPNQDLAMSAGLITVQWQDADPDSSAVISLYAVNEDGVATLITDGLAEDNDGDADFYTFDVAQLPHGLYHLRLVITDGTTQVIADSNYTVSRLPEADFINAAVTGGTLDEAGVEETWVDVSLQQPLDASDSITVNFMVDDSSELEIVEADGVKGANYLQFTHSTSTVNEGFVETFEGGVSAFSHYYYIDSSSGTVFDESVNHLDSIIGDADNDGDEEAVLSIGVDDVYTQGIYTEAYDYVPGATYRAEINIGQTPDGYYSEYQFYIADGDLAQAGETSDFVVGYLFDGAFHVSFPGAEAELSTPYTEDTQYILELEATAESAKLYFYQAGSERGTAFVDVPHTAIDFDKGFSFGIWSLTGSDYPATAVNPIVVDNVSLTYPQTVTDPAAGQTKRIVLRGVDDCDIDGDQIAHLLFSSITSTESVYNALSLAALPVTVTDNEEVGQTLFVCNYEVTGQTAVTNENSIDYELKARLYNFGIALDSASASLNLLTPTQRESQQSLPNSVNLTFSANGSGFAPLSNESFVLRVAAGEDIDYAKFDWTITPGTEEETTAGTASNNTITGTDADDVIDGGAGHDTLYGGAGNDRLIGGAGNDALYGEAGDDVFLVSGSDTGIDLFNGGDGYDTIVGSNGDDVIRMSSFSGENTVEAIDGGAGTNIVSGSTSNNTLDFSNTVLTNIAQIEGLAGHDTIKGSAGDDVIIGGTGNDSLYGNAGDDVFIITGEDQGIDQVQGDGGFDKVLGSAGDDVFSFSTFAGAATVEQIDGLSGTNVVKGSSSNNVLDFSQTELINIARIEGLAGHDTIYGSAYADIIVPGTGNDTLYGNAGNDIFQLLPGDNGSNSFDGGTGTDTIKGSVESDVIVLTTLSQAQSIEIIDGDGGDNTIQGTSSNNTLDFRGTQLVGIASINGMAGHDTIHGTEQADVLIGGDGNDTLYGYGGNDTFRISANDTGVDVYYGGEGVDTLDASDVDVIRLSTLTSTNSLEAINAGSTEKAIEGSSSNNTLDFRNTELTGVSSINGMAGHDVIYGTDAADVISGGAGNDNLYGEGGDDTFVIVVEDTGINTYYGGDGTDTIDGAAAPGDILLTGINASYGIEVIDGGAGDKAIAGSSSNNTLDLRGVTLINIIRIKGLAGHDVIQGSEDNDVIIGGAGNDQLYGNGGDDTFVIVAEDTGINTYYGGEGTDTIQGGDAPGDILLTGINSSYGIEVIDGGAEGKAIAGSSSNNTLDLRGVTLTNITEIKGLAGHDVIYGTDAADVIVGGAGNDTLYGDGGDDSYLFDVSSGTDTVDDTAGSNTIQLTDAASAVSVWVRVSGNNLIVYRSDATATVTIVAAVSNASAYRLTLADGSFIEGQSMVDYANALAGVAEISSSNFTLTTEQTAQVQSLVSQYWQ